MKSASWIIIVVAIVIVGIFIVLFLTADVFFAFHLQFNQVVS